MHITLANSGKRFNRDWIFKGINYTFSSGNAYAIVGNNGSGKSTLLQAIASILPLNEGSLVWTETSQSQSLPTEMVYKSLAIVAPYLELIEEMTAMEFLKFHASFKPFIPTLSYDLILDAVELPTSAHNKQIRFFSSGMKQRIKLAQAVCCDVPVILLDEPCTNLDKNGYALYNRLIERFCKDKLIIVSSNDEGEYFFCRNKMNIQDYKN